MPAGPPSVQPRPYCARIPPEIVYLGTEPRAAVSQIDDLERRDAKRLANAGVHTAGLLTVGIDKLVEAAIGCHHTEHKAGREAGVSAAQLTQLRRGVEAIAGIGSAFLKIEQDIEGNPARG